MSVERLAEVLYFSYLRNAKYLDPRLRTWGPADWEDLPSLSKGLWYRLAEDALAAINDEL